MPKPRAMHLISATPFAEWKSESEFDVFEHRYYYGIEGEGSEAVPRVVRLYRYGTKINDGVRWIPDSWQFADWKDTAIPTFPADMRLPETPVDTYKGGAKSRVP